MAMMKTVGSDIEMMLPVGALISKDQKIVTPAEADAIVNKRKEVNKRLQDAVAVLIPEIDKLVEEKFIDTNAFNLLGMKEIINISFIKLSDEAAGLYNSNFLGFDMRMITTKDEIVYEVTSQYNMATILKFKLIIKPDTSLIDYQKKISSTIRSIMCAIGYKLTIREAGKNAVVITPIPSSQNKKAIKNRK